MGLFDSFRRGMIASAAPASQTGGGGAGGGTGGGKPTPGSPAAKAFDFYDSLGDAVAYPSKFYERPMAAVDVFPEYLQDDGTWIDIREMTDPDVKSDVATQDGEPIETPPPNHTSDSLRALDIWDQFHDKGVTTRDDLQARYGKLMFLAGEAYLVNLWDDTLEESYWQVVSMFQITMENEARLGRPAEWRWNKSDQSGQSTKPKILKEPLDGEPLGIGQIKPYRVWTPHPKYVDRADAPVFSQLDRLSTILTLGMAIRSTARSRLARSGILYINDRILPKESLKSGEIHSWLARIGKHFTTPIENAEDASAYVPIMLTGSLPASEAITHIQSLEASYPEVPVIDHEMERVAHGLDMPAEVMTGLGNTNHWNGWLLDDQQWSHVRPVVSRMVGDFQSVYFFPALKDAEVDRSRFRLNFDESAAVVNPDRGRDGKDAHDRGAISDRALRTVLDFTDGDMPSDENPNNNPKVLIALAREMAGGSITAETGNTDPGQDTTDGGQGDDPAAAPGDAPADPTVEAIAATAMAATLVRCREIAGSRLRNKFRHDAELKRELEHVPNDQVAAYLGKDRVAVLNGDADPGRLVTGASTILETDIVRQFYTPTEIARMRMLTEMHAAATLFDKAPGSVPR